jgi:O-acetyl-ADP-ribose deacetylase (regulator of RNase III)
MRHRVEIITGDITAQQVDAIVNAANSSLTGGAGVDGAIHKAAGPELYEECLAIGGCPTGDARATKAYQLPAKWVIHTVGPIWRDGQRGEVDKLARCYQNSLKLAVSLGAKTIAFPCISTGAYGFPFDKATLIALTETLKFLKDDSTIDRVTFVCFGKPLAEIYQNTLNTLEASA